MDGGLDYVGAVDDLLDQDLMEERIVGAAGAAVSDSGRNAVEAR